MKKIEKIGILCPYPFPEGMAPTTRIIAYGSGLVQNGVEVEVIINTVFLDKRVKKTEGMVMGIKYSIPFYYNPKYFYKKSYRILYANWLLIYYCINTIIVSHRKKNYDYVLFSFDTPIYMIIYGFLLKCFGIKVVFIGDEFPEEIRQLKDKVPPLQIFLFKIAYIFVRARILMTKTLQTYYDTHICYKPTYILPSVIDTSRFELVTKKPVERDYLCYMGNLMLDKDNVDNIICAFALLKDKHKDVDLHLYGLPNEKDRAILSNIIKEKNLTDRVFLMGRASYGTVPQILSNAKILVTSQPITKRAQGGFPTKMCEYMMSGSPTLLTEVGEIKNYVMENVNIYMVEPCNSEKYAEKLEYILTNYDKALEVASLAKKYVINTFGSKQATIGLINFLELL